MMVASQESFHPSPTLGFKSGNTTLQIPPNFIQYLVLLATLTEVIDIEVIADIEFRYRHFMSHHHPKSFLFSIVLNKSDTIISG